MDHAFTMDRIYRYQRSIYDVTRKHYLLGRDLLLERMRLRRGDRVLEVGCGTARNLRLLARARPDVRCFGLDVSSEMLRTARGRLQGKDAPSIGLALASAEDFHHRETFGLPEPFDAVFFSYSLSMIPDWRRALATAAANLRPDGSIYMVDFWDQGGFPSWFRSLLTQWLALFHARHEPELLEALLRLKAQGLARLSLESVNRRYAFLARLVPVSSAADFSAALAAP